ncbi:uncharacterized protein Dana_GF14184 [Drosophila ananassae]|uniref:Uncharacterized protein n=1 Tax=Drosophila ananassae TaxID=7217 RepID=B3MNW3_DROAN|nr:uncharacterized protein LOC6497012 [Drosophila ananassae]EDV32150.1 uncharacterized protein Dana_GF14184 [Drosophila ananassae]
MANNLNAQQVQDLQQESMELPVEESTSEMKLTSEYSTDSVINEIIAKSLTTEPSSQSSSMVALSEPGSEKRHMSFRALARLAMVLNGVMTHHRAKRAEDVGFWRQMAEGYCQENERYQRVVEIQRKRIDILERDLRTLVGLARETQQMLSVISAEKRCSQERGHGEHAD